MGKKSPDLVLYRMIFEVTTLLSIGEKGMTINDLSKEWVGDTHSDEVAITWPIFNRDREMIGKLFGITIDQHKEYVSESRFYIANPHVLEDNTNLKFALNASRMLCLQEFFSLQGTRLDIHHFVDDIEKVTFFGKALMKNKTVKLIYQKHDLSPIRDAEIEPYWLKEYEDRLYIIGHPTKWENRRSVTTYALDRVMEYEVIPTKRRFRVPVGMDPITYYMNVCGVVVPRNEKPQHILIRAYSDEPCYLLTKPIHHSQKLVSDWLKGDPYADFELFLIPTKEFTKKIIERAGRIVVLSPENVRKDFLETIEFIASRFRGA